MENIVAIVAIEPGGTPEPGSEQYQRLLEASIPVVVYFGDYIDNGPEVIRASVEGSLRRLQTDHIDL